MLCYCCWLLLYIFWKDCFTILLCCWNLIKIFTLIIIAQVLEIMFSSSELCSCCKCAYFWILMQRQKSNSWFYYIVQWIIDPDFGALMTEKLQYSRLSWVKHALSWMLKSWVWLQRCPVPPSDTTVTDWSFRKLLQWPKCRQCTPQT